MTKLELIKLLADVPDDAVVMVEGTELVTVEYCAETNEVLLS